MDIRKQPNNRTSVNIMTDKVSGLKSAGRGGRGGVGVVRDGGGGGGGAVGPGQDREGERGKLD